MSNSSDEEKISLVKRLFDSAERLDAEAIDELFTPEFIMVSNDVEWDFQTFKDYHIESYKTRKSIQVEYHDIFCSDDREAARVNIVLTDHSDASKEFMVMLIAQITDNRIHRLWELTFPHWQ